MRLARLLGGIALVLVLGGDAQAQLSPYSARVLEEGAAVRSGPSERPEMYPTNKLHLGDTVEVLEQRADGWLAIKPPPGSFSWVHTQYLKQLTQEAWVVEREAPVLIGSGVKEDRPTVFSPKKVQPETQLIAVGKPRVEQDGSWLPIAPPPTEVRYLQASKVSRLPGPPPSLGAPPLAAPVVHAEPAPKTLIPTSGGVHPLWAQAQQAEQAGRIDEAIQLYTRLGREIANANHDLAVQAQNRAQWLREGSRAVAVNPRSEGRVTPGYATGQSVARAAPQPGGNGPTGVQGSPPPNPGPRTDPVPWTGHGFLRQAGRTVDNKMAYALDNSSSKYRTYVVSQPNVNLETYANQYVEVQGSIVYRADMRAYFVTATQVKSLK